MTAATTIPLAPTYVGAYQWGALLQLGAIAVQLYLLVHGTPRWLAYTGAAPYEMNILMLRLFPSFLLALESCADATQRLLVSGSRRHFAFGNAELDDSEDAEDAHIMSYLQEEPQTLGDAKRHLELIATGVVQLEEHLVALAAGRTDGADAGETD